VITTLLATASCLVIAAADEPTLIHSYIIYDLVADVAVIHYIFTKYSYRRIGLARMLLDYVAADQEAVSVYTHRTRAGDALASSYRNSIYDPYMLFDTSIREISIKE